MTFQNLDIRLDILQQELHLPLTIVSGHIHELTIRIPWTKIASEPIQININTIGMSFLSEMTHLLAVRTHTYASDYLFINSRICG